MAQRVNFGDRTFEELSREAFADVGKNMRDALARMRTEIARLRAENAARVSITFPQPA